MNARRPLDLIAIAQEAERRGHRASLHDDESGVWLSVLVSEGSTDALSLWERGNWIFSASVYTGGDLVARAREIAALGEALLAASPVLAAPAKASGE